MPRAPCEAAVSEVFTMLFGSTIQWVVTVLSA